MIVGNVGYWTAAGVRQDALSRAEWSLAVPPGLVVGSLVHASSQSSWSAPARPAARSGAEPHALGPAVVLPHGPAGHGGPDLRDCFHPQKCRQRLRSLETACVGLTSGVG